MKLTKCLLGELITQRREKSDGTPLPIRGVSKEGLIPPKQIDADTSIYNVFYLNDFIFNPARMELNSIAFNNTYEKAICSSLYEVFYVSRTDLILPEFLELIVKQEWFTRYCEFLGQGSAREYCRFANISEIEIEFPPIEQQKKIVDYNKIIKLRISILRQINDNLEAQAYTIYKDWFIDNGEQHGATNCSLSDIFEIHDSRRIPLSSQERAERAKIYPYYGAAGLLDYVDNYLFDGIYLLMGEDGSVVTEQGYPYLQYIWGHFWVNNHAHILQGKNGISTEALYLILKKTNIKEFVTGAVQAKMSQENLRSIPTITLNQDELIKFDAIIQPIFALIRNNRCEIEKLEDLKKQIQGKLSSNF